MPKVTYILPDGSEQSIDASNGESLMVVAVENDIESILGRCGGECNCGTCHVYVDDAWLSKLPEINPQEEMVLDGTAAERRPSSRLGCQIKLTGELEGLVVTIPEIQE